MSVPQMTLLIVDDDATLRASLDLVFTAMGYEVRTAKDGIAALEAMREKVPEILLSDLNMPRMSGWELLSVVNRRFPQVRAIAMSGLFSGRGIPPGVVADAFYEKGSGMSALMKAVETPRKPNQAPGDRFDPIWIQKSGQNALSEEIVMMSCPECFRTFPQAISCGVNKVLDTTCVHCHGTISYAVLETVGHMTMPAASRNS